MKEMSDFWKRNSFRYVQEKNVRPSPKVLGDRFVMTIENERTFDGLCSARYTIENHQDNEKYHVDNEMLAALRYHIKRLAETRASLTVAYVT